MAVYGLAEFALRDPVYAIFQSADRNILHRNHILPGPSIIKLLVLHFHALVMIEIRPFIPCTIADAGHGEARRIIMGFFQQGTALIYYLQVIKIYIDITFVAAINVQVAVSDHGKVQLAMRFNHISGIAHQVGALTNRHKLVVEQIQLMAALGATVESD